MTFIPRPVASPCISVCLLDDRDVCVGCYRTATEITQWMQADDAAKIDILRRCQERRQQDNPVDFK